MAWLLSLFITLAVAAGTKGAVVKITPVVLSAADGTSIQAVVAGPSKAEHGVVFVHGADGRKEDWEAFADKCARVGIAVLAMDLRGHGANVSGTPPALTTADYVAMAQDVAAGVAKLRANGVKRVAVVGAELGANLALNAAADDRDIASVVLLSPGLDLKGVITPDAVRRYGARPVLFVASQDDAYATRSATALDAAATGDHRLELYASAGKGVRMFNREPGIDSLILGFLNSHW